MRPVASLISAAAALFGAALAFAALAQQAPSGQEDNTGPEPQPPAASPAPPILTLDQDRLFQGSAWGRAAQSRAEEQGKALAAENRRIDEALEKEERTLTERRATMSAGDFARLASEFDIKVEEIRAAQEAKTRAIARRLEEDRQQFFEAATPVLAKLLSESGAVAILADSAIIMSLSTLDITDAAIARIDAVLVPPGTAPAPDPNAAPETAPQSNP